MTTPAPTSRWRSTLLLVVAVLGDLFCLAGVLMPDVFRSLIANY